MTGHNSLRMNDLADLYRSIGFKDAETYIQSGNVIFTNSGNRSESETVSIIEKGIKERFNYDIAVMIRTAGELKQLFSCNPFLAEEQFDPAKVAVIFLHEEPSPEQLKKIESIDYPPDKFKIIGRDIFIFCPNGFGRTKLYTNFFEKKMKVTGTARNWKTITTILGLAESK